MKKLYFTYFLALLFLGPAIWGLQARGQGVDSLKADLLRLASGIDLSRAQSGIIADMGRPYAHLADFDGQSKTANICTYRRFERVFATLADGQVAGTALPDYATVYQALEAATDEEERELALALVAGRYDRFGDDSRTAGKVVWTEDHFEDGENAPTPFVMERVLAAAFSRECLRTGRTYMLRLPAGARTAVGGAELGAVQVNFSDGRGDLVISAGAVTFSLPDTGAHLVQVTVVVDGEPLQTNVKIRALGPKPSTPPAPSVWPNQPNRRVPIGDLDDGFILEIAYADNNTSGLIQNPLLVLPGIDFHDVAPHLAPITEFEDIVGEINLWPGLDLLSDNDPSRNYDLIVVNYRRSTNAIQANANVFKQVIAWINDPANRVAGLNLAQHPTVVVGISMGGLVARLGLAQLVTDNGNVDNTNVRLLFTQDSPHWGANVPLAYQILARIAVPAGPLLVTGANAVNIGLSLIRSGQFPDLLGYAAVTELNAMMESEATKNMLLAQFRYDNFVFRSFYNNTWITDYQNQVANVPGAQYRFVATTVGSECALGQAEVDGRVLMELSGSIFVGLGAGSIRLFGIKGGASFKIQGMPAEASGGEVIQARVYETVTVAAIGGVTLYSRDYNLLNLHAEVTAGDGHHRWDFAPGGYFGDPEDGWNPPGINHPEFLFDHEVFRFTITSRFTGHFCFVPLASALSQDAFSDASLYQVRNPFINNPAVNAQNARLAQFSSESPGGAGEFNHPHPNFTARTAALLFAEVTLAPHEITGPPCGLPNATITGPGLLCNNAEGIYGLNWSHSGLLTDYNWSSPIIVGPHGATQATLKAPQTGFSQSSVRGQAAVILPGGSRFLIDVTKPIETGLDPEPLSLTRSTGDLLSYPGSQDFSVVSVDPIPNGTYSWSWNTQAISGDQTNLPSNQIIFTPVTNAYLPAASINLSVNTTCGPREGSTSLHVYPCCRVGVVSPNPGVHGTDLSVSVNLFHDPGQTTLAQGPFEWELFDARKEKVRDGTASTNPFSLEIEGLEAATYSLEAKSNNGGWVADVNIVSQAGSHLTASPNPARKDIDDTVSVHVVSGPAQGQYQLTLSTFSGQQLRQMQSTSPVFKLPMQGMDAGTYVITVTEGTQTWTEDLDFLLKTAPYLTISPNPATGLVIATIVDPLYPGSTYSWDLVDLNGNVLLQGSQNGEELHIDVGQVPTGYHTLIVSDGKETYQKHLSVVR